MYYKNFTFKEIFSHCTKSEIVDALGNQTVMSNILDLLHLLQKIRDLAKEPITINSAYRDSTHNNRVGGVSTSQHLVGQAADIKTTNMRNLFHAISQFASDHPLEIGQVIMYVPKDQFLKIPDDKLPDLLDYAEIATFFHVALPSEKYNSFDPKIHLV